MAWNVSKKESKKYGIKRVKIEKKSKKKISGSKARGGLSKPEWEKAHGKKWTSPKKKKSKSPYESLIKSIFDVTPKEKKVAPSFEEIYTPELQAEDRSQSEALMVPFYEDKISLAMEDLTNYISTSNVNYQRTLRRARFAAARQGGAIGEERKQGEREISEDKKMREKSTKLGTERAVGTEKMQQGGFQSAGMFREGSLVGEMKTGIEEQVLWHRGQRADRYYGDLSRRAQQTSNRSFTNKKLF